MLKTLAFLLCVAVVFCQLEVELPISGGDADEDTDVELSTKTQKVQPGSTFTVKTEVSSSIGNSVEFKASGGVKCANAKSVYLGRRGETGAPSAVSVQCQAASSGKVVMTESYRGTEVGYHTLLIEAPVVASVQTVSLPIVGPNGQGATKALRISARRPFVITTDVNGSIGNGVSFSTSGTVTCKAPKTTYKGSRGMTGAGSTVTVECNAGGVGGVVKMNESYRGSPVATHTLRVQVNKRR
eukprot:TRINITY_DN1901_c0_g1_i1.p1 TRINITY_DN1901_c0_g1~~TRINITY_DN1901_c0_g1_i1.p1  ORF type:complete len:277 (-),score=92.33 TRINITY_DN1901_c0_g1_i1:98-820(-)